MCKCLIKYPTNLSKNFSKHKFLHIIPSQRKGGAEGLVTDIVRELNAKEILQLG